jgi:hypothetical protein
LQGCFRCGSQKCEELKVFSFSLLIHIFSLYYHPISLRNHIIRLKNWTLRTNSPLFTTEASLEHTWINNYPTMDNISQGFHQSQLQPSSYTTSSVQYNPSFTYIYTLYISLLHITSYLQPKLVYFPCMTAAAYTTTLTCKHIRT